MYICNFCKKKILYSPVVMLFMADKGNRTIADLRYEEKHIISPSTLIFAPTKG